VEVAAVAVREFGDDPVDEHARVGLDGRHLLGRELGVEQPAVLGVLGRVDLERDQRVLLTDRHRLERGRERLRVLQRPLHVRVPAEVHG